MKMIIYIILLGFAFSVRVHAYSECDSFYKSIRREELGYELVVENENDKRTVVEYKSKVESYSLLIDLEGHEEFIKHTKNKVTETKTCFFEADSCSKLKIEMIKKFTKIKPDDSTGDIFKCAIKYLKKS